MLGLIDGNPQQVDHPDRGRGATIAFAAVATFVIVKVVDAVVLSHFVQRQRGDYEWSYLSDYLYDNNPDGIAQRGLGNASYYQNQQLYGFTQTTIGNSHRI